ncbi:Erv26 multi-domain protein [Pyrenophora teres f. maculata]|nr:Erv26 multi-domain protein [Pyrenophora teres f. maculata]
MWILPLLGYVGIVLGFAFLTLAIASGLYYLSELVEEHTVFAKKLLYRLIYGVVAIQILLLFVDKFPIGLSALSVVSHGIYAQNLRRFPVVKLTDPLFLLSCALVIANHYLWFRHFSAPPPHSYNSYPYSRDFNIPTFTEIAAFFGLCVWLVPFALFVSLSAGENVLPSMGSEYATGDGSSYIMPGKAPESFASSSGVGVGGISSGVEGKRRARSGTNAGMAKAVVTGVREWWFLMRLHLHMCFFTFTFTITVLKPRAPPAALATPLLLTLSAIAPSFSSSSYIFRCLVILHSRIESNLPHLEVLQQGLFPGDVKYLSQPEFLNLPAHFHPILIDRIVDFIYTSDYHFCPADDDVTKLKQKDFVFHHATLLPAVNANKSAMAAALVGIRDYEFHLRMYALAEELDWDALKSAAYAKLFGAVDAQYPRSTETLTELVKATFTPPGGAARMCKDEDGALQQLVVAAVLTHETKVWREDARKGFTDSVQGHEHDGFRKTYKAIMQANEDLLKVKDMVKELAAARQKVIDQRRKAKSVMGGDDKRNRLLMKAQKMQKTQFRKEHD